MQEAQIRALFRETLPAVEFASLRLHRDHEDTVSVRQDVLQPLTTSRDEGVMVTVHHRGGIGYGATAELTTAGLKAAFAAAVQWAEQSARYPVADFGKITMPHPRGDFHSPVRRAWSSVSLADKIAQLSALSRALKTDAKIVDWAADLWHQRSERLYLTSGGGETYQDFDRLMPMLKVTASAGSEAATRTFGRMAICRQQGLELLDESGYFTAGPQIAEEALALLTAPNCPEATCDLLLAPDQMVLQIHESIGHPLELDRILGDERNYAGTSFVTPEMIGSYRYGSPLLNVTFDPGRPEQSASYAFDDEGRAAAREYLIRDGVLERGLGGTISQARLGLPGTANSRADSWRRPPIDRMANLNIEPGASSLAAMIAEVENGVYMKTNCSWSIDDSRNKFQFGCEWAQRIESGKLTTVVKKPNYRGISASFWRSLAGVGDASTFAVLGTPFCGKGEPNQAVFVGHATPACLFRDVAVFGGE